MRIWHFRSIRLLNGTPDCAYPILLSHRRTICASKPNGAGADIVFGQPDFNHNASASTLSGMHNPHGVVVSSSGALFVADFLNDRVLRFDNVNFKARGERRRVLGHGGVTSQSSMATPQGVAVDNSGRLYVADDQNNRILIFNNAESKPNGANADIVLGQADFFTGTTNTGGIQLPR